MSSARWCRTSSAYTPREAREGPGGLLLGFRSLQAAGGDSHFFMPQHVSAVDTLRAEFQNRHSGLLTDLLAQYARFVNESPPIGQRQMPERLQHLLRMVRVTGRNFLNEREPVVQSTGMTRDEILDVLLADADEWLHKHGPAQENWVPPFTELATIVTKR